jgi:2,4-dienoyl-CoA reductase-like NADH-dependent reductase (Old Yellow Enzyme family)/NADPH-dependent 2,4-dienoyl-CoA reductase/sulfur reductase-like enzyme
MIADTEQLARVAASHGGDRPPFQPKLLQQPGLIGPLWLKNRVIMGPMGTNYGTTDGFSTERDKQYYAERAKGGVAMIITEAMNISAGARNHNNSLCVYHDQFIPGLSAMVRAIKDNGALAVAQLNHRGQLLRRSVLGMEPVGPTAGTHPATGEPVRALRVDEILAIQGDFLAATRRLWRAGYDAVEIHAANGYLFQQFFSPRFNRRDDSYGGSLENRMRLLLETVGLIRNELPDLPLLVRISATEYAKGGYTEEEAIALVQALERAGVVAIDLSGGTNESPLLSRYCIQPPSFPRRCLEPYARPLKQAVKIPTIIAGRIIAPQDAEGVLEAGSADFISLGRALIADPHWCVKAFGEVAAPIRPCISCNVCFERLTLERDVACVQNPLVGTEFESLEFLEPQLSRTDPPVNHQRLLVVGAGVAGAEAARMAAALGHTVEMWDVAKTAGGQVPLALAAPDKEDVAGVWTYRVAELERMGVPIRLGVQITADTLRRFAPNLVVVATGSRPRKVPMPLDVRVPVLQAWDVLADRELIKPGAKVTMIGGGMVGIETAEVLGARGCAVTVIEIQSVVAREMARNNRFDVLVRLEQYDVRILTETTIDGVIDGKLILVRKEETTRHDPGDAIVVAVGPEPNRDVTTIVEEAGLPSVLVGDCNRPGDFLTAIRDASMTVLALNNRLPMRGGNAAALHDTTHVR